MRTQDGYEIVEYQNRTTVDILTPTGQLLIANIDKDMVLETINEHRDLKNKTKIILDQSA